MLSIRNLLKSFIYRNAALPASEDFSKSAIVFSPHPDDETLGCGGTIIQKKQAGADVKIVIMTDGRHSHSSLISEQELIAIRSQEVIAAVHQLGVNEDDVFFLNYEDGKLNTQIDDAVGRVIDILKTHQPEEIYIPFLLETPKDHNATNIIVSRALNHSINHVDVFEYPVWFWSHWPWFSMPLSNRRDIFKRIKYNLISMHKMFSKFKYANVIEHVLPKKRQALDQYKSQMTKLIQDDRWKTLGGVANGGFLDCFFQSKELFYKYEVSGEKKV
ncbi:PIG-L family deacetylase [candidate division KSB1 bacterium]|nr:PIG-L family deacetylase [candidate division KSB1 bacterium]